MGMRLDATRNHQLAARIDAPDTAGDLLADCSNAAVDDADIGIENIGCGGNAAAMDDGIELCHFAIPYTSTITPVWLVMRP
ncbi:hypothetical protein D3C73_574050 [compost metagenome]